MNPIAAAWLSFFSANGADPLPLPVVPPTPQVVRWADGYVILNGQEVIVRQNTPGYSNNVISGSGNGFGNTIRVDNGGAGGTTVIQNSRNGFGNRILVNDLPLDLPPTGLTDFPTGQPPRVVPDATPMVPPTAVAPPACEYKGKESKFWSKKVWSDYYDCNLYWCPKSEKWFRYTRDDDTYRPVPLEFDPIPAQP